MCWIGAASSASADPREQRLARVAVVGEHPHLDQPVALSAASISLRTAGVRPSSPIMHDRVEVMGLGALLLALGGGQLNGGHRPYYRARA